MSKAITIIQIISAVCLIVSVLLQQRGVGLGSAFGGEGAMYRTKRGIEKGIFIATIVFAVLFFASALAGVVLK